MNNSVYIKFQHVCLLFSVAPFICYRSDLWLLDTVGLLNLVIKIIYKLGL